MTGILLAFFGAGSRPVSSSEKVVPLIRPAYAPTSVFDRALNHAAAPRPQLGNPVIGTIVNHHLIAADFITDTLRAAVRPGIDRIILLSPNHFYAGNGLFITTQLSFATPYGDVRADESFISSLVQQPAVIDNPEPFQPEHGVYNILPFIKKYFPNIPIVPIITRDNVTSTQVDQLADHLSRKLTTHTLVIASLDFAHNQTNDGADRLDRQSLELLAAVDPSRVQPNEPGVISVDSPMTLRLFLGLMLIQGSRSFTLLHHSNSAVESSHLQAINVTSHITGVFRRF